jgi:positive regulator of sigma E activity
MTTDDDENEQERRNRQLDQLLQETRVVMPGVQVLFAFLLAVAFQQRFQKTTPVQRDIFLAVMLCSAGAALCFIAPAVWHRILFDRKDKRHIIDVSNRFLILGVAFLALAMTLAVVLVCDYVFAGSTAAVVGSSVGAAFAWFWFAAPYLRRRRDRQENLDRHP